MNLLEYALGYAARGWFVFPCHNIVWQQESGGTVPRCSCRQASCGKNAGKHPRIKGGFRSASTDPAQITEWWAKWPDANIGISTGKVSGLTVVDLDGAAGFAELQALAADGAAAGEGGLPATLAAQTGSGAHLYFQHSGEACSARGKVHIRGEGGYVIAPPSNHRSGRSYQWIAGEAHSGELPASLPAWLKRYADEGVSGSGTHPVPQSLASALGPIPAHIQGFTSANLAERVRHNTMTEWSPHEEARLRSALGSLAPDNYDDWYQFGMALHALNWERSDGTSIGFDIWDQWSQGCPDKYAYEACEQKWASFGRDGGNGRRLTIASIYHAAREGGWDARVAMASQPVPIPAQVNGTVNGTNGSHTAANLIPAIYAAPAARAIIFPDRDKAGNLKPTCQNARAAINYLQLSCSHDTFHDRFFLGGSNIAEWAGELTDNGIHALRSLIFKSLSFDPGTQATYDAAMQEAIEHSFDPVQDYLDGLQWDQQPRLGTWLRDYLGADDTELNRSFGLLTLTAAVRRTRQPGAKFDQILVLEGPEGKNKSSAIEVLAEAAGPGNYSDSTILTLDDRGQQEAVQGVWLYEIADLSGISKADVERVKAFASRRVDRARPAYGRSRQDRPRRCVFFATTNHDTYLKSQTGNRRFWPVTTRRIDIDALARDRDQLWAEAAAIERTGFRVALPEKLWIDAAAVQEDRREQDPWDDTLRGVEGDAHPTPDGTGRKEFRISTRDLLEIKLRLPVEKQTDATAKRLGHVMRRLGWSGPIVYKEDGAPVRGYIRGR